MFHKREDYHHSMYFLGGFALGVGLSAAAYYAIQYKIHAKALELATDAFSYIEGKYEEVFGKEEAKDELVPLTSPPVGSTNV